MACFVNSRPVSKQYYEHRRKLLMLSHLYITEKKKMRRRLWKKQQTKGPTLQRLYFERKSQGYFENLATKERQYDVEKFVNYHKMEVEAFEELLDIVKEDLHKPATYRFNVNSAAQRLSLTIRYLVSGDLMRTLSEDYDISIPTVSSIIYETCNSLWHNLHPIVFQNLDDDVWLEVEYGFRQTCSVPFCFGSVGRRFIILKNNEKIHRGYRCIGILAVSDSNHLITNFDLKTLDYPSDNVYDFSFEKDFVSDRLNLPSLRLQFSTAEDDQLPFYMVGNESFKSNRFITTPFPETPEPMPEENAIFNQRISRAKNCIDNTFGIIKHRWKIFQQKMHAAEETLINIIRASIVLHNFLMLREADFPEIERRYCPPDLVDREVNEELVPGEWRNRNYKNSALREFPVIEQPQEYSEIRESLIKYFKIEDGQKTTNPQPASVM